MQMGNEDDYLMMSGIQHFDFCRRQWALIHIEQQWCENLLTTEGELMHKICHDSSKVDKRDNIIIMRGLHVVSHKLGMSGACDVVEFHSDEKGITLNRYDGKWLPVPVEYKHGKAKVIDADRLQVCAQGIALEEMLVCNVGYGFIYYKETNRREKVELTKELRIKVEDIAKEMHGYFDRGYTPKVKVSTKCRSCSLKEICVPKLNGSMSVSSYIKRYLEE